MGLEALHGVDAALFMVSDQPMLKRSSVSAVVDCYLENPERIVGAAYDGTRGNPCIFPKKYFSELLALTGDTGGSSVIRKHEEALLLFELPDPSELTDVDYISDLTGG